MAQSDMKTILKDYATYVSDYLFAETAYAHRRFNGDIFHVPPATDVPAASNVSPVLWMELRPLSERSTIEEYATVSLRMKRSGSHRGAPQQYRQRQWCIVNSEDMNLVGRIGKLTKHNGTPWLFSRVGGGPGGIDAKDVPWLNQKISQWYIQNEYERIEAQLIKLVPLPDASNAVKVNKVNKQLLTYLK